MEKKNCFCLASRKPKKYKTSKDKAKCVHTNCPQVNDTDKSNRKLIRNESGQSVLEFSNNKIFGHPIF
jgi:hypothetical protein